MRHAQLSQYPVKIGVACEPYLIFFVSQKKSNCGDLRAGSLKEAIPLGGYAEAGMVSLVSSKKNKFSISEKNKHHLYPAQKSPRSSFLGSRVSENQPMSMKIACLVTFDEILGSQNWFSIEIH